MCVVYIQYILVVVLTAFDMLCMLNGASHGMAGQLCWIVWAVLEGLEYGNLSLHIRYSKLSSIWESITAYKQCLNMAIIVSYFVIPNKMSNSWNSGM